MAATSSDDEYNDLPDDFAGIDWNTIPELRAPIPPPAASANVPRYMPAGQTIGPTTLDGHAGSQTSETVTGCDASTLVATSGTAVSSPQSSQYSFDELDEDALETICAIERSYAATGTLVNQSSQTTVPQSGSSTEANSQISGQGTAQFSTTKRGISLGSTKNPAELASTTDDLPSLLPKQKRKRKMEQTKGPDEGVQRVLKGFEDELTCPICCDIFACAHLGNPCGHSYCGDCGWKWIFKYRSAPTCPICRTQLSVEAPIIPNFAMDNMVEKQVQALADSGHSGWLNNGPDRKEWNKRKAKWKGGAAQRAATATKPSASGVSRSATQNGSASMDGTSVQGHRDENHEFDEEYTGDSLTLAAEHSNTGSARRNRRRRGRRAPNSHGSAGRRN
ncbi:hypothetical protein K474DRAFT_1663257 [Panus rudis PR-1116 ss-1]|nr:hypothetical protein K474DRAFT_1663257 [Panus rudis PR-1116 ss-1]